MERVGCLAALPGFLGESAIAASAFSAKARLEDAPARERQRRYLASHRFDIEPGRFVHEPPAAVLHIVFEVALALIGRGQWTLPSWRVEQALAARATEELGWPIVPLRAPGSGDLGFRLRAELAASDVRNILLPSPLEGEIPRDDVLRTLCDLADDGSPGEKKFLVEVASILPLPLLGMMQAQRDAASLGLDPTVFHDQRVDFAIETPQGLRLVIEIDGSQHTTDAGQAHLDRQRDAELKRLGWTVWRVATAALRDTDRLRQEVTQLLDSLGYTPPEGPRNARTTSLFWSATVLARVQALVLEALLEGVVRTEGSVAVSITDYGTQVGDLALEDLNDLLGRLGSLYCIEVPVLERVDQELCDLLVDVDALHPLRPPPRSDTAVAWSRPAAMAVAASARRIEVRSDSPRFLPTQPNEQVLDEFVRDLFRKDGFRRDAAGHSDQAHITARILQGRDVVGLLPTGAGKSLPYMLAGLLLPGMTLYVGPLISLLQDQAERLRESGIGHVEYISSAQQQADRETALERVQSEGTRFLLVSPERFLTAGFLAALANRELWRGDISQVVIDECHCVSEWGHEFRPAYLSLGRIARERSRRFGTQAPLVALTGTASTVVLADVLRELGIADPAACVRAANLDRPELSMRCTAVHVPDRRDDLVEVSVRDFIRDHPLESDGLLIFCPFRGGRTIGVFSVAAHLSRKIPGIDVRFYCGGDAPWRDYAVFYRRRRAADLSNSDIEASVPNWGRTASGLRPWPEVKAAVQRDFISGTKRTFRVLVATKAFGMGIDKPSIRKIIHTVAPTSPEAFYQEIGRAGRDRQPSRAELLFCDIRPETTNRILDPGRNHQEVLDLYREATEKDPYGGGDFLRTFYFHGQAFQGMEPAVIATYQVVRHLHNAISASEDPIVPFQLTGDPKLEEKDVEYGLVRLVHLGVVAGYLKDYNRNVFRVDVTDEWLRVRKSPQQLAAYLAEHFATFIRRYHLIGGAAHVEAIRSESDSLPRLYDMASRQMMSFVYHQLERQRRAATRAMLEIARIGAGSGDQMRARLLNYLQASVRFTSALEALEPAADPETWVRILVNDEHPLSPQDLAELHGAAQRVLASFPTHPGLLFLSGVSRPMQTDADPLRSGEEFEACVRHASSYGLAFPRVLWAFSWFREANLLHKAPLAMPVDRVMGRIHLDLASDILDLAPFLHVSDVRNAYLSGLVRRATDAAELPRREHP